MSSYTYVAVDPRGSETRGTLDVADQSEALRRLKDMGLFPTKVLADKAWPAKLGAASGLPRSRSAPTRAAAGPKRLRRGRLRSSSLTVFTRQLATLIEAGMPLLRGLRTLHEQEENRTLKRVIGDLAEAIENGSSLAEAVAAHPNIFNRLYVNMVKAGEIGGALEITLKRLAEFMEKAQKIRGKIKAAMFYPCAVLLVAIGIVLVLMAFVVPRFKLVFLDLLNGVPLPAFTVFVFGISEWVKAHLLLAAVLASGSAVSVWLARRTYWGCWCWDQMKLWMPVLGTVFRKLAISRFARTLGTLVSNGVPILQALTIVKETAGNLVVGRIIELVHDNVKQGDAIAPTLKNCRVFPVMVAGMVDVGEQTGALPEMLLKIADNYDEEVDNAASAMTSLLEPIMILLLAIVVGSIVIAMFWPIVRIIEVLTGGGGRGAEP